MSIDNIINESFEDASETVRPEPTPYDKDLAVFVAVPIDDRDRLARAGTLMTQVYREINKSETLIYQLGFYTYRVADVRIFVFNPSLPTVEPIQKTKQTTLGQSATDVLPDRLATVVDALNEHLPTWLTPEIGPWWLGAFGRSPPAVCRLVMPGTGKITRDENLTRNCLAAFIKAYSDEPYLYQAIIRHRPSDLAPHYEYSFAVRIALFAPAHQVHTESDLAGVLGGNRPRNPTRVFEPLGVTSNWDAFDSQLHQRSWLPDSVRVGRYSRINTVDEVLEYATGDAEWAELRRERHVGADEYDHVCDYTELIAREADLKQFFTLATPNESPSPWPRAYGRNPGLATVRQEISQTGKQTAMELSETRSSDADAESDLANKERSSANDGSEEHWTKVKLTARIYREQGYDVSIIEQDARSRPDLWVRDPDGTIYAVEVECTSPSNPANALSNISRSALWGYPVIVVATDEGVANRLRQLIAKPFKNTDDRRTRLYNADPIAVDDQPVLVPADTGETEWWVTPAHTRELKIGSKVIAETPLDAPFDGYDYPLPRLDRDGDQYVVRDQGSVEARYQSHDRFKANWRRLTACHVPVGLSYFQFVHSMHVIDDNRLVEYHPSARWDRPANAERHEASHDDAFTSFLIDKEGADLDEPPVREFIRNWISAQTQYDPPADSIYGQYRQDYTDRSRNDDRHGANKFYTDKAYRFPRGVVHPGSKGLTTTPTFPNDWEIPDDQVLQEPLVHGLTTRETTCDPNDE